MAGSWRLTGIFCLGLLLVFCEAKEPLTEQYRLGTLAFYNVENLFDTVNDTLIHDDDRTPLGKDRWTDERYQKKIADISRVLSGIGADLAGSPPDIIGLCEVENQEVMEDLIQHPNLRNRNYGIIHFDSPDERGIDVALLYKREVFLPVSFTSHRLLLFNEKQERDYTRDQLVVSGIWGDEVIYVIVNHWPSRSGGESRSKPFRIEAARLNKRIMDSIGKLDPFPKIITMGDFNDEPVDDSIKHVLQATGTRDSLQQDELFNPMEPLYTRGFGSLAYRDTWSLFDQIIMTGNWVAGDTPGYRFWKAGIYNPDFLITPNGRYSGYPYRTYLSGIYTGGYSDHFPVYVQCIRKVR